MASSQVASPQMIDHDRIVMGIGNNRSYRNLQKNPNAAFIIMEPGPTPPDWKGVRVHMRTVSIDMQGDLLHRIKEEITNRAGNKAGESIAAAVKFSIVEVSSLME